MKEMERWDIHWFGHDEAGMQPNPDGIYVKRDAALDRIEALEKALLEANTRNGYLESYLAQALADHARTACAIRSRRDTQFLYVDHGPCGEDGGGMGRWRLVTDQLATKACGWDLGPVSDAPLWNDEQRAVVDAKRKIDAKRDAIVARRLAKGASDA